MVNRIGKVIIYVNNQEEAKKFWIEKLDFIVRFEQQMSPNLKWLEVAPSDNEYTSFVLYDKNLIQTQSQKEQVSHPYIMLHTENIKNTYEKLKSRGVEVGEITDMPFGKLFKFKDQDGNEYTVRPELMQ